MMDAEARPRVALELGVDHGVYGEYALGRLGGGPVWAISVGADRQSPSRQFKGDPEVPNEDGLLVIEDDARTLLAVADAHFGAESSHDLLRALAARLRADGGRIPAAPSGLAGSIRALGSCVQPPPTYRSETTLLVAVYDRGSRRGFGVSFGDSSFAVLGPAGVRLADLERPMRFASPARPASLDPDDGGEAFAFAAAPGELLIAFTDGIDGCHYNHPETSVTPAILADLFAGTPARGADPEHYARALIELALAGVDGHPGGQDNIALIVAPA